MTRVGRSLRRLSTSAARNLHTGPLERGHGHGERCAIRKAKGVVMLASEHAYIFKQPSDAELKAAGLDRAQYESVVTSLADVRAMVISVRAGRVYFADVGCMADGVVPVHGRLLSPGPGSVWVADDDVERGDRRDRRREQ